MISSMTGFGAASASVDGAHFAVEVRSLNNKYYKAQIRLPDELQALEAELDTALSHRINRGSILATVRYSDSSENAAAEINTKAIQRYLEQLFAVPGMDHDATRVDLTAMLHLPGVVVPGTGQALVSRAREPLLKLVDEACDSLIAMRKREGEVLHQELHKHCDAIRKHLEVVVERVPVTVDLYQERLRQRVNALLSETGATVGEDDLIKEVAFYAERSDVAEEVARLQGHLAQFAEIIDASGDEPSGRTLEFLSQELLREANTIGSKCLDVEISRRIVEIKGGIDRIKEQVQNVE